MSEFDFDELDKAVNALMDKTAPESKPVTPAGESTPISSSPSAEPSQASVPASPNQPQTPPVAPAQNVAPKPAPQVPVAVTPPVHRGQFMDMKPQNSTSGSEMMPARSKASVIAPLSSSSNLEPATVPTRSRLVRDILPPSAVRSPANEVVKPTPPEVPATQSSTGPGWPDPITMTPAAGTIPQAEQIAPSPVPDQAAKENEGEPSVEEVVKPPEFKPDFPLFVPDAKVDKRPLGGASQGVDEKVASSEDKGAEPLTGEVSQELPPELGQDILSVESRDTSGLSAKSKQEMKPESRPDHLLEAPDMPAQPVGAVSIPQQYKEAPNTGNEEHAALYETASYTPLQHPSKKKSGWLAVLIIVILLIVFGATAAALYYLHIL